MSPSRGIYTTSSIVTVYRLHVSSNISIEYVQYVYVVSLCRLVALGSSGAKGQKSLEQGVFQLILGYEIDWSNLA